jgi:hypothetical protein
MTKGKHPTVEKAVDYGSNPKKKSNKLFLLRVFAKVEFGIPWKN